MKFEIGENKKWRHSLTLKMVLLGIMGLFLMIPLEMIKSIIKERQQAAETIKKEIAFQWAGQQTVSGPVLNVPVKLFPLTKDAEPYRIIYHFMPENLNITGDIKTEKRHRSIYQAIVYNAGLKLTGNFIIPGIYPGEKAEILWEEGYYTLGITDSRGLKGNIVMKAGSSDIEAVPGLKDSEVFNSGITFPAKINDPDKNIPFTIDLQVSGSEGISFSPVGKTTKVNIKSLWNSPGFKGNFLPVARTISESGFKADWVVTNLNRGFPQVWSGKEYNPETYCFGVDFILLVDHYQKSLRSAKYGVLFIVLSFLALLFIELGAGEKLHIFHYLLTSLALVLFFSLLNALSEHIGFNIAYLLSSVATIILIIVFLRPLLEDFRLLLLLSGLLVFLYSFIFILLTLNDYTYLAGTIGLFVLLAITMRFATKLRLHYME